MILDRIGDAVFERLGTLCAGLGCCAILAQCIAELRTPGPGSLSPFNLGGYLVLFIFWTLYGLRFRRRAIWVGNLVATVLQGALLGIWLAGI